MLYYRANILQMKITFDIKFDIEEDEGKVYHDATIIINLDDITIQLSPERGYEKVILKEDGSGHFGGGYNGNYCIDWDHTNMVIDIAHGGTGEGGSIVVKIPMTEELFANWQKILTKWEEVSE